MSDDIGIPFSLRRGPSGELGLLVEGRRHNLLLHSNDIEKLAPELAGTRSGKMSSIVAEESCPAFRCDTSRSFSIKFEADNPLQGKDFTVSLYGVLASSRQESVESIKSIPFELSISDGRERKVIKGSLNKSWNRHHCSILFSRIPTQIYCEFSTLSNLVLAKASEYQFGLTCLCLEEGLFPSSPIITTGAIGLREPDILSLNPENLTFNDAGTLLVFYQPLWTHSQLTPGIDPIILEFLSDARGEQGVRLVHDSQNNAQLRLDVWSDSGEAVSSFSGNRPPPANDVFVTSLNWEGCDFSLLLDGDLITSGQFDRPLSEMEKFYVASGKTDGEASLFAHIKQILIYPEEIADASLHALLYTLDPGVYEKFHAAYDKLIEESKCPMIKGESLPLVELLLRVAASWSVFNRTFDNEAGYRDSCAEILFTNKLIQSRESLANEGETDLTIHIPQESDVLPGREIKIEFKIWPRNDYNEVPTKPIKYMSEYDEIGAVFMIANHKRKDVRQEFRELVISNREYPYIKVWDQPLGAALPFHFVTQHRDPSTETDKFILSILISSGSLIYE